MRLVKQSILFFKEGNSDKVYEIDLCDTGNQRYVVNFRYGKRDTTLREGTKTPTPVRQEEAEKIFDSLETEKIAKGYTPTLSGKSSLPKPHTPLLVNEEVKITRNWTNAPKSRNRFVLQRLHQALTGEKNTIRSHWKLSRVIWKAGQNKIPESAPYIIKLFNQGDLLQQYSCCWALGRIGTKEAIAALTTIRQSQGAAKLAQLAGIGLLNSLTGVEKEQLVQQHIQSLPEDIKTLVISEKGFELRILLAERLAQQQPNYSWLETLYLLSTDRKWLKSSIKQTLLLLAMKPGYFKHIRTIYKWSELLDDFDTLGLLSCKIEREPELFTHYLSALQRREIKTYIESLDESLRLSAEFAKTNSRLAYSNKTRWYLHKRTLRNLYSLGLADNTDYVRLATGILIAYNRQMDEKAFYSEYGYKWSNSRYQQTEIRFPANAQAIYMHQILSGDNAKLKLVAGNRWQIVNEEEMGTTKSSTIEQKGGLLKMLTGWFSKKKNNIPEQPIEENANPLVKNETGTPFLHLWNQLPQAYVQLLMDAQMDEIHQFAENFLKKHPDYASLVARLDITACKKLLRSAYKIPAAFGFTAVENNYAQSPGDTGLIIALLNCIYEPARIKGRRWTEEGMSRLMENSELIVELLFIKDDETRRWGHNLLSGKRFAEDLRKSIAEKSIVKLLGFSVQDNLPATLLKDGCDKLWESCSPELQSLSSEIILDLLQHPIAEVLLLGLRILSQQKQSAAAQQLPDSFIDTLLQQVYEPVRFEGLSILKHLSTHLLLQKQTLILNHCISQWSDVRKSIKTVVALMASADRSFGIKATSTLMPVLLRKEQPEGVHADVSQLLCNELSDYLQDASREMALHLLYSKYSEAQNVGVMILEKYTRPEQLSLPQVLALGDHENFSVREWCWSFYNSNVNRIKYEKEAAVKLLDSKWLDTRMFAQAFFRERFEEKDWDADGLITLADSVKPDTEAFARELITKFFVSDNGVVYLQKLSQHPHEKMQLFVTNYLERFAAGDLDKMKALEFYFRSALTRVNKGRTAKNRVFSFLLKEGRKSEQAACYVSHILSDISATAAIEDKAKCIDILLQLKRLYNVDTPVKIIPIAHKLGQSLNA